MFMDFVCSCCGGPQSACSNYATDFSTWDGFGKLWTWAQEQKWWEDFLNVMDVGEYIRTSGQGFTSDVQSEFINPDRLAHTVYEYLQMDE